MQAQQNRVATVKAAYLDAQITVADAAFDSVDNKAALKEADPQSASMAKAGRNRMWRWRL